MLPLHGQSTAAVENLIHWAGPTPYGGLSRSHVFDKQAEQWLCRVPLHKFICAGITLLS